MQPSLALKETVARSQLAAISSISWISWISRLRGQMPNANGVLPLKKALLDPSWLLFYRFIDVGGWAGWQVGWLAGEEEGGGYLRNSSTLVQGWESYVGEEGHSLNSK